MRQIEQTEGANSLALLFKAMLKPEASDAGDDGTRAAIFAGLMAEGQALNEQKPPATLETAILETLTSETVTLEDAAQVEKPAAQALPDAKGDLPAVLADLIKVEKPLAPDEVKVPETPVPLPQAEAPVVLATLAWQAMPAQTDLPADLPAQQKIPATPEPARPAPPPEALRIVAPMPAKTDAPRRVVGDGESKAQHEAEPDDGPKVEAEVIRPLPFAVATPPAVPLPSPPQPVVPTASSQMAQAEVQQVSAASAKVLAERPQPASEEAPVVAQDLVLGGDMPEPRLAQIETDVTNDAEPAPPTPAVPDQPRAETAPTAAAPSPIRPEIARDLPAALQTLVGPKQADKPASVAPQFVLDPTQSAALQSAPVASLTAPAPAPLRMPSAQTRADSAVVAVTVTTTARTQEERVTAHVSALTPLPTDGAAVFAQPTDAPAPFDFVASEPPSQSPPIALDQPDWEAKLVERLTTELTEGGGRIELTLTPENLGRLEVTVDLKDGRADVSFVTDTREAADLITQSEARLSDLLAKSGLDLAGQGATPRQGGRDGQGGDPRPLAQFRRDGDDGKATPEPLRKSAEGRVNLIA